jgi:hypothetical protein
MMQDQSHIRTRQVLYWFRPSGEYKPYVQSSIVDMWFLATNFDTLDRVRDIDHVLLGHGLLELIVKQKADIKLIAIYIC